jgi:hypothetical protein
MPELGRKEFQYLYEACFTEHERGKDGFARFMLITDEGVFYDARLRDGDPLGILSWKYVHELAGLNKPSSSGPALPFKSTPSQFAAFMLWGWGIYFQDTFGRLDSGPNVLVLNDDHEDAADAYETLRQAYVVYRDALSVVGELDHQEQQRAHDLLRQSTAAFDEALEREKVMEHSVIGKNEDGSPIYGDFIAIDERLARVKEAVAAQKAQALQVKAEADVALKTWRRAMVRQLLQLEATTPGPAPGVAVMRETAQEDKDTQDGERIRYEVLASRTELIGAFSLYGVELKIFKALKDRPGLHAALRVKGKSQRGSNAEPMFCPYEVINWLVERGVKDKPRLSSFTAWHILETKFPSVYAEKSIGDPRHKPTG